jgi:hypothetical protein
MAQLNKVRMEDHSTLPFRLVVGQPFDFNLAERPGLINELVSNRLDAVRRDQLVNLVMCTLDMLLVSSICAISGHHVLSLHQIGLSFIGLR